MILEYNSGSHIKEVEVAGTLDLEINLNENTSGKFILIIKGEGQLNFNLNLKDNSDWNFLWLNKSDASLKVNENTKLLKNTNLKMNYSELSQGSHEKDSLYEFLGDNSNLEVKGASLVANKLKWNLLALHHAKKTYANLDNHAIVLENANLDIEVTGQIDKGYSGSETHQMTRIMNLAKMENVRVFPKLLIDENDVAASHAATVGKPDVNHIYYLQSRGITKEEALKLLIKGYLLPITSDIEDETIKEELINEIEKKVDSKWM